MKINHCVFLLLLLNTFVYGNIHKVEYKFYNHYNRIYPSYPSSHATNHAFVIEHGLNFWQKFNTEATKSNIAYEEKNIIRSELKHEELKRLYHLAPLRALRMAYYESSKLYLIYLKKYLNDRLYFFQKIKNLSIQEKKQLVQSWCSGHMSIFLVDNENKKNIFLPLLRFDSAASHFAEEILKKSTEKNKVYYLKKQQTIEELNDLLLLSKHNIIYMEYYFHSLFFSCIGLTDEEISSQIIKAKYIIENNFAYKDYILK